MSWLIKHLQASVHVRRRVIYNQSDLCVAYDIAQLSEVCEHSSIIRVLILLSSILIFMILEWCSRFGHSVTFVMMCFIGLLCFYDFVCFFFFFFKQKTAYEI